jgi:hypothetical protein
VTLSVFRCPPTDQPLLSDGVVGLYFTAISVIIVYHLFALQTWLNSADSLRRVASEVERRTVTGDVEREDVLHEIAGVKATFPWVQVLSLGIAICALCALALAASVEAELPFLYGGTPTLIMFGVFIGSTIACSVRGTQRLRELRELLAPGAR